MRNTTDDTPTPCHLTQAELARRTGVNRSSLSRATSTGALRAALLPSGLVDARHPAVGAWASRLPLAPEQLFDPQARATNRPRVLVAATHDPRQRRFVAASALAARAGVELQVVVTAARAGELAAARLADGRLDTKHPAAKAFVSAARGGS